MSQRKSYSEEFRKSAVARVDAGVSQSQVAIELGASLSTLNKWIKAANSNASLEEISVHESL